MALTSYYKKYSKAITVIIIFIFFFCISFLINNKNASAKIKENETTIFVDIKGAVNNPGVYEMNLNSRIINLIDKAGGLRDDADTSIINLSKKLKDEDYIIIYSKEEIMYYKDKILSSTEVVKEIEKNIICPDKDNDACINNNSTNKGSESVSLVNINLATLEELTTLPGIGETKANKIIEYRKNNEFKTIEDIKNVSGIGDSAFEKIKDYITV